jgi:two-component system, OmpR family, sensor histidine kinase KdpD
LNNLKFGKTMNLSGKRDWKPTGEMFTYLPGYIWGILLVAVATFLGQYLGDIFSIENILALYLLIVVIAAIYWGLGPAIAVSISCLVALDYFFIPPQLGFIPFRLQDVMTLIVLLVVSVLISYLASRFRQKTVEAKNREREASTLYSLSRELAKSTELDPSIATIVKMGKEVLGSNVAIFLPGFQNKGPLKLYPPNIDIKIDASEYPIIDWSYKYKSEAGWGTGNFSSVKSQYLPLVTSRGTVGVMRLWRSENTTVAFNTEQLRLLQAYLDLTAVCLENIRLAEEARAAEILNAKEKLQTAILNSISHDLRTPLVSVIGVLGTLQEDGADMDDSAKRNLIEVAYEDAERLNRLITNLLGISRIESGAVKLIRRTCDVADLIGVALEQLGPRAANHRVEIDVPTDLPLIFVDFSLIVQVLFNILDNSVKYSPLNSLIEISGRNVGQEVEIEVADRGIGIPPEELPNIFAKFYRIQRQDNIPGTGLGLYICKGIIESHGGHIIAENRLGGGTIIKFALPIEAAPAGIGEKGREGNG